MIGQILFLFKKTRFGYIRQGRYDFIFFEKDFQGDFNELQIGQSLEFEAKEDRQGWRAFEVHSCVRF
jgi:hypothetical protein